MEVILKDGISYLLYNYRTEEELEKIIFDNCENIFGNDTITLPKRKIQMKSGIGTIPDGYVLSIKDKKWYVVEIELSSHPLHDHIVIQISKFNAAINNTKSREELKNMFYNEIVADPWKNAKLQYNGISEIYKYISDIIKNTPEIVIFIDNKVIDLDEACKSLPFRSRIVEFKTYCREGTGEHIYQINDPLNVTVTRDNSAKNNISSIEKHMELEEENPQHIEPIPPDNNYDVIKQTLKNYKNIKQILYKSPNGGKIIWIVTKAHGRLIGFFGVSFNTFESVKENHNNAVVIDCYQAKKLFIIPVTEFENNILSISKLYGGNQWKMNVEYEDAEGKFYINPRKENSTESNGNGNIDITDYLFRDDLLP